MYHVRIEIIFLCCELLSNSAWFCRADPDINSLSHHHRELILSNVPSNTMCYLTIIHRRKNYIYLELNLIISMRNIIHNSLDEIFPCRVRKYFFFRKLSHCVMSVDDLQNLTKLHLKMSKEHQAESEEKMTSDKNTA